MDSTRHSSTRRGHTGRSATDAERRADESQIPEWLNETLQGWLPLGLRAGNPASVAAAMPQVRVWVGAMQPDSRSQARRLLWAAAGLAVWIYEKFGTTDPRIVWHPRNIEVYIAAVSDDRSPGWRSAARSALRRMGPVINPDDWSDKPQQVGRSNVSTPYRRADEEAFRLATTIRGRGGLAEWLWVPAGSLGAGMTGPQLAAAGPSDLVDLGDGRLGVRLKGPHARLVPIRKDYTGLAAAAQAACRGTTFVPGSQARSVYAIAEQLRVKGLGSLSLRRARATWLLAHLIAGTPLGALRAIAGPIAGDTLTALLREAANTLSPQDAAVQGLRA